MIPKIILTDIDGVWTDGSMYYDQTGNELKRFHTYDSYGVMLAHNHNIPIGIITGENTNIVSRRAEKLKIDFLFQGVIDKVAVAQNLCCTLNITLKEIAYIGDDLCDLELLRLVGFSGAPQNAIGYIKENVDYVTSLSGGYGAFREFVEVVLKTNYHIT